VVMAESVSRVVPCGSDQRTLNTCCSWLLAKTNCIRDTRDLLFRARTLWMVGPGILKAVSA
jgi:hypothetical protein